MFKKLYKEANDEIKTNRELIDKIFEASKTNLRPSRISRIYKYGAAIAAVFVIAFSVAFYENIVMHNETVVDNPVVNSHELVESKEEFSGDKTEIASPQNIEPKSTNAKEVVLENAEAEGVGPESQSAEMPVTASLVEEPEGRIMVYDGNNNGDSIEENYVTYRADLNELTEVSVEEAERITEVLIDRFGRVDSETQNEYIFEIVGLTEVRNEKYYLGRWKWFVVDHSSLLTEFVMNESLTEMFGCERENGDTVTWVNDNNLLTK